MCGVPGEHRVALGPIKNPSDADAPLPSEAPKHHADAPLPSEAPKHQEEREFAPSHCTAPATASTASSSQRIGDLRVDAPSRKPAPQQHRSQQKPAETGAKHCSQQKPAETGAKHRSQAGNNSADTASQQSNASTAPSTAANANQVQRVPATPTATQVKGWPIRRMGETSDRDGAPADEQSNTTPPQRRQRTINAIIIKSSQQNMIIKSSQQKTMIKSNQQKTAAIIRGHCH